jgi:CBS domain-containing protein
MRTVGELIQGKSFYTANSDQSVYDTARYMAEKDIGAVPILEDSRLVGIFSERDIIKRVIVAGRDVRTTLVKDVMTTELVVAQSTEEIAQVLEKMQKNRCRHMPVVVGDRLAGFLSLRDLLSADLEEKDAQVQQLNTYIYYSQ